MSEGTPATRRATTAAAVTAGRTELTVLKCLCSHKSLEISARRESLVRLSRPRVYKLTQIMTTRLTTVTKVRFRDGEPIGEMAGPRQSHAEVRLHPAR